jgi:hypothetical protein
MSCCEEGHECDECCLCATDDDDDESTGSVLDGLPAGVFVAPEIGVNFAEPWTIVRDE